MKTEGILLPLKEDWQRVRLLELKWVGKQFPEPVRWGLSPEPCSSRGFAGRLGSEGLGDLVPLEAMMGVSA